MQERQNNTICIHHHTSIRERLKVPTSSREPPASPLDIYCIHTHIHIIYTRSWAPGLAPRTRRFRGPGSGRKSAPGHRSARKTGKKNGEKLSKPRRNGEKARKTRNMCFLNWLGLCTDQNRRIYEKPGNQKTDQTLVFFEPIQGWGFSHAKKEIAKVKRKFSKNQQRTILSKQIVGWVEWESWILQPINSHKTTDLQQIIAGDGGNVHDEGEAIPSIQCIT